MRKLRKTSMLYMCNIISTNTIYTFINNFFSKQLRRGMRIKQILAIILANNRPNYSRKDVKHSKRYKYREFNRNSRREFSRVNIISNIENLRNKKSNNTISSRNYEMLLRVIRRVF